MTELEKLNTRLFDMGAKNVKIFHGEQPASAEDIAREMNRALDEIASGTAEISPEELD